MKKLKCTKCHLEFGISAKKNERVLDHYVCPDCTKATIKKTAHGNGNGQMH